MILQNAPEGAWCSIFRRRGGCPHDAVSLLQSFYDFPFSAYAGPGERALLLDRDGRKGASAALDLLSAGSVAGVTLPTPSSGPPLSKIPSLPRWWYPLSAMHCGETAVYAWTEGSGRSQCEIWRRRDPPFDEQCD